MALLKLRLASFILLEDDYNINLLPLITELVQDVNVINILSYEHPVSLWLNVFKNKTVSFLDYSLLVTPLGKNDKRIVLIDSVNQMAISLGWDKCLKKLKTLASESTIMKLIIVLHKDCIVPGSKIRTQLNYITNAIVSYDTTDPWKVKMLVKMNGKVFKSEELLSYDHSTSVLTSREIKLDTKEDIEEKILPNDISTFKIEIDQLNQLAKHNLKLPYMSKINEGQGKVYYEPDAVDDWDEEDPDDDLDI